MRKVLFLLFTLSIICAVILIIIIGKNNRSAIRFETEPEATVYVDNVVIGDTPIEFETNKKEANIKLVSKNTGQEVFLPYETKLSLTPHTKVIVRHKFLNPPEASSSQILQLLETKEKGSFVTIITNQPNAFIYMDDESIGASPVTHSSPPGEHHIQIVKEGFGSVDLDVQTFDGYNLFVSVDLPKSFIPTSPTAAGIFATILSNQTGFVTVRRAPSESASEITRVFSSREYKVLGFDGKKEWVNISLNASESGWVSSRLVGLSSENVTP